MEILANIYNGIMSFTAWMWSLPVVLILIGGGLIITVACDFVQIKHFGFMLKKTFSSTRNGNNRSGDGISGVQAMVATLANTIGTGNIVGVASAIAIGGPGAVFWMWVIGFVAMALKYAEATLAVATRTKDENGNWQGGANHYLSKLWKPIGLIWGTIFVFGTPIGCGMHAAAIVDAAGTFYIPTIATTIVVAVIVTIVILGGVKRLVNVTDKLVPIMAVIYILTGTLIIVLNINNLIPALVSIFTNAFTGTAAVGGFIGSTVSTALSVGCARGVLSNDGGNGVATILHSQADVEHPVEQGMYGIFEVFACTLVICTFTALVVLCTGEWQSGAPGSVLAINAFGTIGPMGHFVAAVSLILFATSSVLSMAGACGISAYNMFGKTGMWIVQAMAVGGCVVGGLIGVDAALPYMDVLNMFSIILNVGGMLCYVKLLRKLTLDFFSNGNDKLV